MIVTQKYCPADFLPPEFFRRHHLDVARELIGSVLTWDGCSGLVVETEAYAVHGDAACHTASRPGTRDFVRTRPAGTAYVYLNYGMYWLANVLVKGGDGDDGIILIRALEPLTGIDRMRERRSREKLTDLCSGPGKLARALGIDGRNHGEMLAASGKRTPAGQRRGFLHRPEALTLAPEILSDVRVGIRKATDLPWRFLWKDNPHVSVRHSSLASKRGRPKLSGM